MYFEKISTTVDDLQSKEFRDIDREGTKLDPIEMFK